MSATGVPAAALPPVAIGGVGGSGTRLIAEICQQVGYYIGGDLHPPQDNRWFTLLFKRTDLWPEATTALEFDRAVDTFRTAMVGGAALDADRVVWLRSLAAADRLHHSKAWLNERVETLIAAVRAGQPRTGRWGWKEPNTHIFLDRLASGFPGLKYVHVVRNGLDMAHSRNQNQLEFWGPLVLGTSHPDLSPRASLNYWCIVHRRVARIGARMPGRFLWLNYDALCAAPRDQLGPLLAFLEVPADAGLIESLAPLVRPPDSVGRFKQHSLDQFDPADVAYVKSLGFDVA